MNFKLIQFNVDSHLKYNFSCADKLYFNQLIISTSYAILIKL